MASYIDFTLTFTDNSSGDRAEDGTEVQIYTDSPSYKPTVKVDYNAARHAWMALPLVNAGVTTLPVKLKAPVTFVKVRVRQFNANGFGDWNLPGGISGTTFVFTQNGGVNTPDSPTNVGLIVTGTPTPPVDPPVDPPPDEELPPTGGGGVSSNYVYTAQFSNTQGQNQWSYRDALGAAMTYNAGGGLWTGAQAYQGIWNGGIHPGGTVGSVLRWTAPSDGVALVSGSVQLFTSSGSNGVTFTMKKNATTIDGPASLTTTTPRTLSESVTVVTGDVIDFIVEPITGNTNCSTALAPVIQHTTDGTVSAGSVVTLLSPAAFDVSIGGTQIVTVFLSSPPAAAATITLSSSDSGKVTVPASIIIPAGIASGSFSAAGVALGASTLTAAYNSTSKTSIASAVAPSSSTWANAPSGGVILLDHSMNSTVGLLDDYSSTVIVTDTSAPVSPPNVGLHRLGAFQREGGGQLHYIAPALYRELYCGFAWRTNAQFQGRAVQGNKIFFLRGPYMNGVFALLGGPNQGQSNFRLAFSHNTSALNNSHIMGGDSVGNLAECNVGNGTIIMGVWYRIEVHIRCSTSYTARDGFIRWWINGTLVGNYTQFNYSGPNGEGANEWMMNQTWDGSPDLGVINTVNWDHYVDHVYLVGKN